VNRQVESMSISDTSKPPFRRLLIANRGEIALRVLRTARELGIETVAVYSDADRTALHVRRADRAVHIGASAPSQSYLRIDAILAAAKATGCDAIHPGYGFLSENAKFSQACIDAGITFVGPSPHAIRTMGDKVEARAVAKKAGVPLVPGLDAVADPDQLLAKAEEIGYPVMLKAAAGGGGKGIRIVREPKELAEAAARAKAEAEAAFGDGRVYLEKFVTRPRHVEVQVIGDSHGNVVAWGERECSVQRRHQKLVEESPCAVLDQKTRADLLEAACRLARAVDYVGAGTVEFLYSHVERAFYFLEMNTRLQVEHPITEMRFGIDLVAEQLKVAAGGHATPVTEPHGHAIEVRINAEHPETFFPSLGTIQRLQLPQGPGVRLDAMLARGVEVTAHYDSMIGKLIVHGTDRQHAIRRCLRALSEFRLTGLDTSLPVAQRVLRSEAFVSADYDTGILESLGDDEGRPDASVVATAKLAAALAQHLRAGDVVRSGAEGGAGLGIEPWVLLDRMDRLGRRLPR
jgi:acetyl-CoA carboxylase biotin carboxylase subunit